MKNYSASDFRIAFQGRFNPQTWQDWLVNFFGATTLSQKPEPVRLPSSEKDVKGFLLGELTTSDGVRMGLFRYMVPAAQIERRRVGLNSLVKPWLKYDFDAALAVFDAKDTHRWRFSLVADMRGEKTLPRRYTYVFGDAASQYRTAVERFVKVGESRAQSSEKPVSFAALKEAFAVESLTKEFYSELFNWYLWALSPEAAITFPNDIATDADDRVGLEERLIRLITRVMFVWFILQKKLVPELLFDENRLTAWLKDFDPHSMTSGNYYNAILQNLFFATLNNEIADRAFAAEPCGFRGRAKDYGIKTLFRNPKGGTWFKRPNAEVLKLFREIPFLNGGLFECLDKAAQNDAKGRIIYNDGFSREEGRQRRAFIPNELFFGEEAHRDFSISGTEPPKTVSGLLKILGRYNFTIEENSPDDMDVALDPELLGKVFENLLGSFNPETRETARKDSGSFYTPREIVSYMVEESLDAYMRPVADRPSAERLDHLMKIRVLDPACGSGAFPMGMLNAIVARAQALDATDDLHALKLHVIENCIFGVDIQTIAVQIAKLRFFISLICEEQPNLTDAENNYGISPLPNLETKFVAANSLIVKEKPKTQGNLIEWSTIDALKRKLDDIRHRHFNARTRTDKLALRKEDEKTRGELSARLTGDNHFDATDARRLADWNPYDQNESAGFFDPEWMFGVRSFDVVIGNPPYIQLQAEQGRLGNLYRPCGFKTFARTGDIYCLFYERGWQLLKPNGHLCFITSNKWMRAGYGEATRKFLAENTDPQVLIDFAGERIFESATVDTNVLLFEKSAPNSGKTSCCIGTTDCRKNLSDFVRQAASPCAFTSSESWVILSPIEQSIKRKIEAVGTPLKDWNIQINYGIKTGCNEAFIIDEAKRVEILSWCKDASERERTEQLIRPILRGRDIKRYGYNWAGLYLIATHNGYVGTPRIDINNYPAVKRHLDSHWVKISRRADKGDTPYNLRNCAYMDDFSKPKIVWGNLSLNAAFAKAPTGMFINAPCVMITPFSDYLLAVLNSKLGDWYIRKLGVTRNGGYFEYKPMFVEQLPVPKTVTQILTNTDIYQLYGLSSDEIDFIDAQ